MNKYHFPVYCQCHGSTSVSVKTTVGSFSWVQLQYSMERLLRALLAHALLKGRLKLHNSSLSPLKQALLPQQCFLASSDQTMTVTGLEKKTCRIHVIYSCLAHFSKKFGSLGSQHQSISVFTCIYYGIQRINLH